MHQAPPSAKGNHFITLEYEDGLIDVIVRPQVYSRYRGILHKARLLLVEGKVQSKGGVITVLAHRMAAIANQDRQLHRSWKKRSETSS